MNSENSQNAPASVEGTPKTCECKNPVLLGHRSNCPMVTGRRYPEVHAILYRKKPVVIEAVQWFKNGDHPNDYDSDHDGFEGGELRVFTGEERRANRWEGDIVRYFRRPDVPGDKPCQHCAKTMNEHGWIDTLEGGHIVCPGDWIIKGVKGEFYPCKPDIFTASYEPADQHVATRFDDAGAYLANAEAAVGVGNALTTAVICAAGTVLTGGGAQ